MVDEKNQVNEVRTVEAVNPKISLPSKLSDERQRRLSRLAQRRLSKRFP